MDGAYLSCAKKCLGHCRGLLSRHDIGAACLELRLRGPSEPIVEICDILELICLVKVKIPKLSADSEID